MHIKMTIIQPGILQLYGCVRLIAFLILSLRNPLRTKKKFSRGGGLEPFRAKLQPIRTTPSPPGPSGKTPGTTQVHKAAPTRPAQPSHPPIPGRSARAPSPPQPNPKPPPSHTGLSSHLPGKATGPTPPRPQPDGHEAIQRLPSKPSRVPAGLRTVFFFVIYGRLGQRIFIAFCE